MSATTLLFIGGLAGAAPAADCMGRAGPFMPASAAACAGAAHGGTGFCARAQEGHHVMERERHLDLPGFFPALARYAAPPHAEDSRFAQEKIIGAGFAMGSEFLWEHHYAVYRQLAQRAGRGNIPVAPNAVLRAGRAFCLNGAASCHAEPVLQP